MMRCTLGDASMIQQLSTHWQSVAGSITSNMNIDIVFNINFIGTGNENNNDTLAEFESFSIVKEKIDNENIRKNARTYSSR